MLKILVTTVVAWGLLIGSSSYASPVAPLQTISIQGQTEIDQDLVERIIRYVQVNYGLDYSCICDQYKNGIMTIDKVEEGYLVRVLDGGNLIEILVDESI